MGSGLAKEIRSRFPGAAEVDRNTTRGDYNKLGNWSLYSTGKFIIVNAYTQYDTSNGQDVFEYAAFELILKKLYFCFNRSRIGFPMLGMGLAGGDSKRIIPMIEEFATWMHKAGGSATLVEFG